MTGENEPVRIVKALSLRQPWAWAVLHGKWIENRKWNTTFRGRFYVHASLGMTHGEYDACAEFCDRAAGLTLPPFDGLLRGGIVGESRLVEVLWPAANVGPWSLEGQYGFQLEDSCIVPFVPCSGRLGFFNLPGSVLSRIESEKARVALASKGGA